VSYDVPCVIPYCELPTCCEPRLWLGSPRRWAGLDKFGDVVVVERTGRFELPEIIAKYDQDDLVLWNTWHLEWTNRQLYLLSRKQHRLVRLHKIIDLEGLTIGMLSRANLNLLQNLIKNAQAFYPEVLVRASVIRAPRVFGMAWKLIKGQLSERTTRRVLVKSGAGSERALLERIDPDVLAVEYGGARDVMFGAFPKMSAKDAACSMQSLEAGSNQNAWGDFLRTLKSP